MKSKKPLDAELAKKVLDIVSGLQGKKKKKKKKEKKKNRKVFAVLMNITQNSFETQAGFLK